MFHMRTKQYLRIDYHTYGNCVFFMRTSMYALGILPLTRQLDHLAHQLWFADDASAGGSLTNLQKW